ncbi:GNAT family N-acetyltransferase [Thalassiella azotivora]
MAPTTAPAPHRPVPRQRAATPPVVPAHGHRPGATDPAVRLARRPWALGPRTGAPLSVRGVEPADLAALATLHARCSRQTLLQRYRTGGRAPSLLTLAATLREPLVLAAFAAPGHAVALATADVGSDDGWVSEVGLLVEDAWQGRGVGTALARHLAVWLRARGAVQLTTRSASASVPLLRVMEQVGETRSGLDEHRCTVLTTRIQLQGPGALAPAG